jgi:hypothetical protein
MMTRAEHLEWCKKRALEYARAGELQNAVASMGSDLNKHPETRGHIGIELGVGLLFTRPTQHDIIHWIEGFN